MEQLAVETVIDLFGETLPPLDQLKTLAGHVHSSEKNQIDFNQRVESHINETSKQATGALGIGLFILGRYAEAIEKLQKAKDSREKFIYL